MRKRRLLLAGYGVFAALLFVAFVAASFPYTDTISALVAPIRMKVVFQKQEMSFPIGARLQDVRLLSTVNEQLLLQSPDVTVAPGVAWLLIGSPCLKIRAQIYGGVVEATVRQRSQATIVVFELESLNLAQMSPGAGEPKLQAQAEGDAEGEAPDQLGVTLSGELSGSGTAHVTGPEVSTASASMILLGRGVKVAIVNGLPPLELGAVNGKVLLEQHVATLRDVRAHGSDGDLEVSGEIQLAPDVADSTVQLTVSLTPTAKGRANFGVFLNMLPHTPGEGPYHVEGPLTFPSVS
jgi:type II secretion system protein N